MLIGKVELHFKNLNLLMKNFKHKNRSHLH